MRVKVKTKADPRLEQFFDNLDSKAFTSNFVAPIREEQRIVLPKSDTAEKSFQLSELISLEIIVEANDSLDASTAREEITKVLGANPSDITFSVTSSN